MQVICVCVILCRTGVHKGLEKTIVTLTCSTIIQFNTNIGEKIVSIDGQTNKF